MFLRTTKISSSILPYLLLFFTIILFSFSFSECTGGGPPDNVDFDPHDAHKTTFCTCQCCKDTLCYTIPNATFAVASCFECTKFVCDALGYPCKTTLFRATCLQKNDILSQIIIVIVLVWILSMVVASIIKAYCIPLVRKIRERFKKE